MIFSEFVENLQPIGLSVAGALDTDIQTIKEILAGAVNFVALLSFMPLKTPKELRWPQTLIATGAMIAVICIFYATRGLLAGQGGWLILTGLMLFPVCLGFLIWYIRLHQKFVLYCADGPHIRGNVLLSEAQKILNEGYPTGERPKDETDLFCNWEGKNPDAVWASDDYNRTHWRFLWVSLGATLSLLISVYLPVAGTSIPRLVELNANVMFATESSKLRPEAQVELARIMAEVEKAPPIRVMVAGHTDSRGSDAHNKTLSEKRADAVREWLADQFRSRGLTGIAIEATGYGESRLKIDPEQSDADLQANRRVEITLYN